MLNKKLIYFFTLLLLIVIVSCRLNIPPEKQVEDWIAMIDVDGNNLQFICRDISTPYFIPDPDNPEEEIILLDGGIIELMNLDGSNRRTIIDSVDNINCFSEDRTKMLLATNNGEIYIANTDGTGVENLTNTPDIIDREPSFSLNEEKVLYHYIDSQNSVIVLSCMDLSTTTKYHIYEEEFIHLSYFISPVLLNDNTVIFGQSYTGSDSLGIDGLYLFDGQNKVLLDPGYISAKISFNKQSNLIIYRNSKALKLYHPDTNEIETINELHNSGYSPVFNRDGSLLAISQYIHEIPSFNMFSNVLQYFEDDISHINKSIDFNETSTKVIMNLGRVFPNSNEE